MNSMKKRLLAAAVAAAMAVTAFSGAVLAETEPAAQPAPAAGTEEYRWSFELKFDANGGTGAPATMTDGNNDTYRNTNSFKIPQQEPRREGYVFLGWSEKQNATAATYKYGGEHAYCQVKAEGEESGFGTKTLYAVWEEESEPTYRWSFELKFDANGGEGAPATMTAGKQRRVPQDEQFQDPAGGADAGGLCVPRLGREAGRDGGDI